MENTYNNKEGMLIFRILFWSVIVVTYLSVKFIFGFYTICSAWLVLLLFVLVQIICGIIAYRKESYVSVPGREIIKNLGAFLIAGILVFYFSFPSPMINGRHSFQYKYSKMYAEKSYSDAAVFLPDKLPDNVSDYSFYFFSGFMQAGYSLKLNFKTDAEGIAEIKKYAESMSEAVLDLEMYRNDRENSQVSKFKESYFNSDEKGNAADFKPDCGNAIDEDGNGEIFIISFDGNRYRPHTACITINCDMNIVSFSNC